MYRLLILVPICHAGCTANCLERYTVNQVATLTDLRFQAVLDNLAVMAANRDALPSYAPLAEGSAQVSNTMVFDPKAIWARAVFKGFSSEALGLVGMINPQPYWTVNPVDNYQKIQAMHFALQWAVLGPPDPSSKNREILDLFQIRRSLEKLPPGWLGMGRSHDVPHCACYRAHHKGHWVWVMPENMPEFSAFTLILQDIATVDPTYLGGDSPVLSLKIKHGDGPDAPTVEAKVTSDVRPLIVPLLSIKDKKDQPEPPLDKAPQNRIKEIIASPPRGLGLKEKNERFVLPADFVLTTTQPPNVDPLAIPVRGPQPASLFSRPNSSVPAPR